MALVQSTSCGDHSSTHGVHQPHSTATAYSEHSRYDAANEPRSIFGSINAVSELDNLRFDSLKVFESLDNFGNFGFAASETQDASGDSPRCPRIALSDVGDLAQGDHQRLGASISNRPFQKWMRSLHRRATQKSRPKGAVGELPWPTLTAKNAGAISISPISRRHSLSSGSSFGFVSAVRSASVSLASVSAVARSRRKTASHCLSRTDRSSRASYSAPRVSEDSIALERAAALDEAATERSLQRRRILEELISTEESYIGDVRFLINVYVTILASLPTPSLGLRSSINRNLTEIIELHEEILSELHQIVPDSEYTQVEEPIQATMARSSDHQRHHNHRRWRSLDAVPENKKRDSWFHSTPGMLSDPHTASEVSQVFEKKMNRFFIYKEYGAKYEMMIKDVASVSRAMPEWETYQKGLETLAATLSSTKRNELRSRTSLTVGDLLVKPIQRICKYPLLFAELLRYTPVVDCPNSHLSIDATLTRLREATAEINRATDDSRIKSVLEKTWLLQDRLIFNDRKLDAVSKNQIRSFGHIHMCGSLYICWQTKQKVDGQYMICLLYRDLLCLASASRADPVYTIRACIRLNGSKIEEADSGRGMQCHTAPFSWKLVFECDHQLYEIIMTACTPKEELEWRARLSRPAIETGDSRDIDLYSCLDLDIKSLGTVFGKPGTIARRISIHRATTVGPKTPLYQVILKNTSAVKDGTESPSNTFSINRSQSLLTTNTRIPVLAPARSERARLESLLADVWSREILPFPGMALRSRSEHLVRTSASSLMRKLSVASIAGSFNMRSGSASQRGISIDLPGTPEPSDVHDIESRASCSISTGDEENGTGQVLGDIELIGRRGSSRSVSPKTVFRSGDATTDGTVRHVQPERFASFNTFLKDFTLAEEPTLRTSSVNSFRLNESSRSEKSTSGSFAKENTIRSSNERPRGSSRWPKVTFTKAEGKAHGFRSLFR